MKIKIIVALISFMINHLNAQTTNGKLTYITTFGYSIDQSKKDLNQMYEEAETKQDSLNIARMITRLEALLQKKLSSDNKERYIYQFYKDTVHLKYYGRNSIWVPKTFEWYSNNRKNNKLYVGYKDYSTKTNTDWNTTYTVTENKDDQKVISNLKGHKIKIVERRTVSGDIFTDVYELFVSDTVNFPLTYYSFLNLKKDIDKYGLVLEVKSYDIETPKNFEIYTLVNYNTEIQNRELLKNFNFKETY